MVCGWSKGWNNQVFDQVLQWNCLHLTSRLDPAPSIVQFTNKTLKDWVLRTEPRAMSKLTKFTKLQLVSQRIRSRIVLGLSSGSAWWAEPTQKGLFHFIVDIPIRIGTTLLLPSWSQIILWSAYIGEHHQVKHHPKNRHRLVLWILWPRGTQSTCQTSLSDAYCCCLNLSCFDRDWGWKRFNGRVCS